MLIRVRHVTLYRYAEPVKYSVQRLHLSPPSFGGQRVRSWRIEAPGIDAALAYQDAFGNLTHVVSQTGMHEEVTVTAEGEVETEDRAGVVSDLPSPVPEAVFLRATPATMASPGIMAVAAEAARFEGLERLHALMSAVRSRIDYRIGTTHAHTTAAEALEEGMGVCQDHAHVYIAALRHLGVPARYVSGYMVVDPGGAAAEASHGWAEALVPGLGWVGFDVANVICPTDRYVRVAAGPDARSVAPVTGARLGGAGEALAVSLDVLEAQ
jgi:transglutaminase-like putative cysteine protease